MSKLESLIKQVQVFEKLAVYGNRKDFLNSIAQNLSTGAVAFPDETINSLLGSVIGSITNLVNLLSDSPGVSTPNSNVLNNYLSQINTFRIPSYVNDKIELDAKANPLKALLGNSMVLASKVQDASQTNMSGTDSQVHDTAAQVIADCKKAVNLINIFYRDHGIAGEDMSKYETSEKPVATVAPVQKATPHQNVATSAKSLAASLESAVDKLPTGPERAPYLGKLDQTVKTLQNYFKQLQKSTQLQDYFARMEIVSALQKLYSALDYADLDHVKSLDAGRNIPETPDSKIV